MEERYLYKAKRTDNREWVQGALLFHDDGSAVIFNYNPVDGSLQVFDVDPSTSCQCTTFKDRNGNLVWENDLLKEFTGEGNDWEIAKVILGEYCLSLGWCQAGVKSLNQYNTDLFKCALNRYDVSKSEIVGNVFDNPELLEK